MAENGAYPGVTGPLSLEAPKQIDVKLNDTLMQELKAQNNFEQADETQKRVNVLNKLAKLLHQLVQLVGRNRSLPQSILQEAGGRVFTFGSYRLGVYGPSSDIDTLLVAPKHVTRDDFFQHMPDLLRKSTPTEEITELTPVPGISVPIIKLHISGVSVDLIFCSLNVASVPKSLELTDNSLLRGLDETDLRCVNGTRVTDRILQLVPQTKIFRIALRAVKLWAQRRAIYGNVVGFPGGVAYAMMVARVCQFYPKATAALIVQKFFFVMSSWSWPSPVLLQKRETAPLQLREWDPQTNKGDRFHLMPVITPAYPCMNSTHTISVSTKAVLVREMKRGLDIMNGIYEEKRPWKDLFARHRFFSEAYKHYICVITGAQTKEAQQAWSGLVQSKLRRLISGIENSDADSVELVQPFNKGFDRVHECKNRDEIDETLAGSLQHQVQATQTTDEAADIKVQAAAQGDASALAASSEQSDTNTTGKTTVWTTTYYMGIGLCKGANNLDIVFPIQEFKRLCREWENHDENMHSIQVKHLRSYQLPDDVFVEGETKPTKKKSKKEATAAAQAADKKRSTSIAGLDENRPSAKRQHSVNGNSVSNSSAG